MAINWDKALARAKAEDIEREKYVASLQTKTQSQTSKLPTANIKGSFAGVTPQMQANATAQIERNKANKEKLDSLKSKAQPLTFNERVSNIRAFGGNSATAETREKADLYQSANSPSYRFMSGVAEGISPIKRGEAQTEYGRNAEELRNASALNKVGNLTGEMASFAIPYAGLSGKIGAAVEKLPTVAKLGKTGQAVAKSVATDLAIGLPLNTNYAINKEGKTGMEAVKSIATNTAIDVALGGAMEMLGGMLKRSAKQAIPAEEVEQVLLALPAPAEKDIILSEIKAKGGATQEDIQKLADLVNAEKSKLISVEDVAPMVEQSALPTPTKQSIMETIRAKGYATPEDLQFIADTVNAERGKIINTSTIENPSAEVMATQYGLPTSRKTLNATTKGLKKGTNISFENINFGNPEVKKAVEETVDTIEKYIKNYKDKGFSQQNYSWVTDQSGRKMFKQEPSVSLNDKWYQDFYEQNSRKPKKTEAREIAEKLVLDVLNTGNRADFYDQELYDLVRNNILGKNFFTTKTPTTQDLSYFMRANRSPNVMPSTKSPKGANPAQAEVFERNIEAPFRFTPAEAEALQLLPTKSTIKKTVNDIPVEEVIPTQTVAEKVKLPSKSETQVKAETKHSTPALGADNSRFDTLEGYAKTYGTFEGTPIPKATPYGDTSQTAKTLYNSLDDTGKEAVKDSVINGDLAKFTQTNQTSVDMAMDKVNSNYEGAYSDFINHIDNADKKTQAEDIALGAVLIRKEEQKAAATGDYSRLNELFAHYTDLLSTAGRTLQAAQILKRMTPEGRLYSIQRAIKNIEKKTKLKEDIILSDETLDLIAKARTEDEILAAQKKAAIEAWEQVPPTLTEKINAWRYMSMLLNPKTHVRNITGNGLFGGVKDIKNAVGVAMESILNPEVKTKAILTKKDKALRNFADDMWNKVGRREYKLDTKFSDSHRPMEARVFKTNALEKTRQFSGNTLELEDEFFGKRHYQSAFAQYMKANNLTAEQVLKDDNLLAKINQFAIKEANDATFKSRNWLSDWITKQKKGKMGFLFEATIPFAKTPANVLARGIEYSPLGAINTILDAKALKSGAKTANDVIDDLAKTVTGTGLMSLGSLAYYNGIVTKSTDYDKESQFKAMTGNQDWSLVLPNGGTYSIDSFVPSSMSFLVGAELAAELMDSKQEENLGSLISKTLGSIEKISNPLIETSMLKGVMDTFNAMTDDNKLVALVSQILASYGSQFVPTIGGQIVRTIDNERKSYTSMKKNTTDKIFDKERLKIMGKLPGVSDKLEPYIDVWGRTESAGLENKVANAAYQLLSPGYYKGKNETAVDKEVLRLAEALPEDKSMFPSVPSDKKVTLDENVYEMTAKDWTQYQKTAGQYKYKELDKLIKTQGYKSASNEEKLSMIEDVYKEGNSLAKAEFLVSKGVSPKTAYSDGLSKTELEGQSISGYSPKEYREKVIDIKKQTKELGTDRGGVKAMVVASGNYKDNMATALGIDEEQQSAAQQLVSAGWTTEDLIDVINNAGSKKSDVTKYLRAYPSGINDNTIKLFYKLINKTWADKISD